MRFKIILCLLLISLSTQSFAADKYRIDPEHTFSSFEYDHWGLSKQRGRFDKTSGMIELDIPAGLGSIQIEIDSNSISTGSDTFNKVMRSSSFFESEEYPKITFNSTKLVFAEGKLTQVEGSLKIKETTKTVTLEITHFGCRFVIPYLNQACGANGQTKILRSDFKIGRYVPFVSDEITLYISVEGIKE